MNLHDQAPAPRALAADEAVERVTRGFYERFKAEHDALRQHIAGIPDEEPRRWYASVLLSRLMALYFIQQRGLLAGDAVYLQRRLAQSAARAADRYYAEQLCPLFFHGLACPPAGRTPATRALLGDVPYLNGGLFQPHPIERRFAEQIAIPDRAFTRLFDFFDQYQWRLDERPPRDGNEITPDVLGYALEKYINQKQMGAYYTRGDITAYIARSTIIPHLLDELGRRRPAIWDAALAALRATPDRYIYPALRHGAGQELPAEVAAGLDDVGRRELWNRAAPADHGLTGEIWRETLARRQRYAGLREAIAQGRIAAPDDLVTANLDLQRLALDVVEQCGEPDGLLACWQTLSQMSILDPTCGSGAFLFAALSVLEPLYAACLERMEQLVADASSGRNFGPEQRCCGVGSSSPALAIFSSTLSEADAHPSRRSFILASIIANNLFGVDIMDEAVEICRLRLFLKLAAQIDDPARNVALPALDRNIRAGNALVGFANTAEGEQDELDRRLARAYGVDPADQTAYQGWRAAHRPLHWPLEFPAILARGGFDVVIGNPPYVGYSGARHGYRVRGYATEPCGNLYALTVERALALLRAGGRCGMIVPIASVSTVGMARLQQLYAPLAQWHSHYAVRPGKLFAGVDMNLTISLLHKVADGERSYVTGYRRWSSGAMSDRPFIFTTLAYVRNPRLSSHANPYPKLGSPIEARILQRMLGYGGKLRHYTRPAGTTIYYHSGGRYWRKALLSRLSSHYKPVTVAPPVAPVVFGLLNSQLFYWYWISNSNCMDVVSREVLELPVFPLDAVDPAPFAGLMERLLRVYAASATTRVRRGERIRVEEVHVDVQQARPVIDEIDRLLAAAYGLDAEELDFILNYDIKYRCVKRETGDGRREAGGDYS